LGLAFAVVFVLHLSSETLLELKAIRNVTSLPASSCRSCSLRSTWNSAGIRWVASWIGHRELWVSSVVPAHLAPVATAAHRPDRVGSAGAPVRRPAVAARPAAIAVPVGRRESVADSEPA